MTTPTILDHTQDLSGVDQHRLTNLYPPPEFVKQASHEQVYGDPEKLQPSLYAWSVKRAYPCHTKAATWMSALFFADKRASLPDVQASQVSERLLKSAAYWNIRDEVESLWSRVAEAEKNAQAQLLDDQFALVWDAAGRKERHYPLRNGPEVKLASDWFGKYHTELSFADKHTIASKIMTKAAEFNAPVENTELLNRCAGYGRCSTKDAAAAWQQRASLTRSRFPGYSKEAAAMAKAVLESSLDSRDHGQRVKMASLLDQFDRQTGLHTRYDQDVDRPEDVLFVVTEKVASDFLRSHVQTVTGAVYEKTALASLDIDTVRDWLGEDLADACGGYEFDVEKLAVILPTLPRPEARMFEQMAASAGIGVTAREKDSSDAGLTLTELTELAAQYGQDGSLQPVS